MRGHRKRGVITSSGSESATRRSKEAVLASDLLAAEKHGDLTDGLLLVMRLSVAWGGGAL